MKERLLFLICFLCISFMLKAADKPVIKISTENVDLIYRVGDNGRLYQSYLGKRLNHATDIAHLPQGSEAYLTHGMEDYFEPAIHIVHNDGNPSTLLKYISHTRNQVSPGVDEVVITMQDDKYPVTVKLHYVAYQKENLIKTFTEISHREKKPVQLHKYAAIGMAKTTDFKTFVRVETPFLPFNRNAVLFPRKINGNFVMLSRPSDSGHTPFGDIFLSESPDLTYWGKHRHVMGKSSEWWESLKIGGGAAPIETTEGWLLFYHGVSGTCNGYVYSIGGAILDIDNPSIVKYRCQNFLLTPEEWFEERGFVPNVTFPCATIHDAESGKIAIYYGCADTYVGLAFTEVDEIVSYIKKHSVVTEEDTEIGKR